MSLTRVGIIRDINHPSFEKTNELFEIFQNELKDNYKIVDIFIDQDRKWHYLGIPILPMDLHHKVDILWNPNYGDISQILSHVGIPHISHNPFNYILENNKDNFRRYAESLNLKTPQNILIPPYQGDMDGNLDIYAHKKAKEIWNKFSPPYLLHTISNDKNIGNFVVKTFPDLVKNIYDLLESGNNVLIEEIIIGDKKVMHFLPNFRNQKYYSLYSNLKDENLKNVLLKNGEHLINNLNHHHYLKISFIIKGKSIYIENISFDLDLNNNELNKHFNDFGIKKAHIIEHILQNAII